MIYSPYFFPVFAPIQLPNNCQEPPTLYSILQSIVNYNIPKEDKIKIPNLANGARNVIFNFEYPLSSNIKKEDFECMILNHFLMRRIGFETVTLFQLQLQVKLNEIMPVYNKLFDLLPNWKIFEDGETVTRDASDNRNTTNQTSNTLENNSTTNTKNTSDRRFSDTPQNELQNIQDGKYITNYNYDTENANGNDNSISNGNSNSTVQDNNVSHETISRTPSDKMRLYSDYLENKQHIYSMIFKELECLFYQLV